MNDDVIIETQPEIEYNAEMVSNIMLASSENDEEDTIEVPEEYPSQSPSPKVESTEGTWSPYNVYRFMNRKWMLLTPYYYKDGAWKKVKANMFKKG